MSVRVFRIPPFPIMKTIRSLLALVCFTCGAQLLRASPGLVLEKGGVAIDTGSAGRFLLRAPEYASGQKALKSSCAVQPDGAATITYPNGFVLRVAVSAPSGEVRFSFDDPAPAGDSLKFLLILPISFNQGGRYAMAGDPFADFPSAFAAQLLVHGEAQGVALLAPGGAGFSIATPEGWQAVQDNRKWKWEAFAWTYNYDFNKVPGRREFTFKISSIEPPAAAAH